MRCRGGREGEGRRGREGRGGSATHASVTLSRKCSIEDRAGIIY